MLIQGPHSESSLANACPELSFFSLHVKCTQKDFLFPQECTLASLPLYIQNAAASSSGSSQAGELACPKMGGKFQEQNEAIFNSSVHPGGLQNQQLC